MKSFLVQGRRAGKTAQRRQLADIEERLAARAAAEPERKPPEFETEEVYELWSEKPVATYRRCLHANQTPVQSVDDVVVAYLCLDCEAQIDVGDF